MMREFKAYIAEHRDLIFTVLLIVALDSLLLKGAFRERIQLLLGKVLTKAEKKLDDTIAST